MKNQTCDNCARTIAPSSALHEERQTFCSARCRDLGQIRNAFNSRLSEIVMLGRPDQDPGRALAILEELRVAWLDRDHDGWLDGSTRSHRAMILEDTGQYQEALDELRIVEVGTPAWTGEYVLVKKSIARTLESAGRHDQALAELESVITDWQRLPQLEVLGLLRIYADIATSSGHPVDDVQREVFTKWAAQAGITASQELIATDFQAAILDAVDQGRKGERRFSSLIKELEGAPTKDREDRIHAYIDAEPIVYMKERARTLLERDEEHGD